jgi:N4-gp56 family major capsid protein
MANTISIDALRRELWAKELMADVIRDVENAMQFVGPDSNNVIQVSRELAKGKGDTETFGLVARLTGDGVTGDDELEGNEEAQLSYAEQVAIDQIRHGVRLKGKLDAQKVVYDQIASARENLRVWMKEFLVRQFFLKLAGVTNTTLVDTNGVGSSVRATWSNTPDYIADADTAAGIGARYLRAGTTASGDGADDLVAADVLTLDDVTKAATLAKLANPKIQPLSAGGDDFYVMFIHPLCARDIRMSDDWKDAQELAKVRSDKNPVFRGALGYWSNVLLLENEFVPWLDVSAAGNSFRGAASGTDYAVDCAANVLCGRQAVLMAEASNPEALVVEQFDYKNKDGVAGSFIGGLQKAMFNSKEFGVIVLDAAAAL